MNTSIIRAKVSGFFLLYVSLFLFHHCLYSQGTVSLSSGLQVNTSGNCFVVLEGMNLENNGTFQQAAGGTVVLSGNSSSEINGSGSTSFYNLVVNKSANSDLLLSKNLVLGGAFTFTEGQLQIKPGYRFTIAGNAVFNGKSVTLQSDATGTASLGTFGGTVTGASNVTVERFIPVGRKWRGISVPLKGSSNNTFFYNWQNNGGASTQGYGALIWKPGGTFHNGDGYSNGGSSSSLRAYNGGFVTPANTKAAAPLFTAAGAVPYLVFITDFYQSADGAGNISNGASATTLAATGEVFTGTYTKNGMNAGFHFLPNPYPSAVDFAQASRSAGIANKFWVWDPKLTGKNGVGGYVTITNGESAPLGGSYTSNSTIIPQGSAFWIQSTGTNQSLSFTEAAKSTSDFNVFGRVHNQNQRIRVNLYDQTGQSLYDGILVVYNPDASAALTTDDAEKFTISQENISIRKQGKDYAIEFLPPVAGNDTILLQLHQMKEANYRLIIETENISLPAGVIPFFQDRFQNSEFPISLNTTSQPISFTVSSLPESFNNRFQIVFRSSTVTPVRDLALENGITLYPNPVAAGNSLQLSFSNLKAGRYTVLLYDVHGAQVLQQVVMHGGGNSLQIIRLGNKLSSGTYLLDVISETGSKTSRKLFVQ